MSMPVFEGSTRHLAIGLISLIVGVLPALVVGAMTSAGPAILTAVICGLLGFFLSRQAEQRTRDEERRIARQSEQAKLHRKKLAQTQADARAASYRRQMERERQEAKQSALASIRATASQASATYLALSMLAEEVENDYLASARQFADGAYSPFWSSIENAYRALGQFSQKLGWLAGAASQYPQQISSYTSTYGDDEALPGFPVDLESSSVLMVGKTLSCSVGDLVYTAQKNPVFAQIWEQRRTTAAVVAGFATLDHAIGGMTRTLSSHITELNRGLSSQMSEISRSVDQTTSAIVSGDHATGRLLESIGSASNTTAGELTEARTALTTMERRARNY